MKLTEVKIKNAKAKDKPYKILRVLQIWIVVTYLK